MRGREVALEARDGVGAHLGAEVDGAVGLLGDAVDRELGRLAPGEDVRLDVLGADAAVDALEDAGLGGRAAPGRVRCLLMASLAWMALAASKA